MKQNTLLIAILLALSGCSMIPEYTKPTIPQVASFKEPIPEYFKEVTRMQTTVIPNQWLNLFDDKQLLSLLEKVEGNFSLQASKEAQLQYLSQIAQTQASLYPTLNLNQTSTKTNTQGKPTTTQINNSANLTWEIDLWGKTLAKTEAAKYKLESAKLDTDALKLSISTQVVNQYNNWKTYSEQINLLNQTIQAYQDIFNIVQAQFKAGTISYGDVAQAEAQLKSAMASIKEPQLALRQTENAIAVLIGENPSSFKMQKPETLALNMPKISHLNINSELLLNRPDIQAAEQNLKSLNAQIGAAKSAFFPSLSLTGSLGLSGLAGTPLHFWTLGNAITQNIFNGGATSAALTLAEKNYTQAALNYKQTVLQAFQEVEDQLATINSLNEEINLQIEAISASKKYLTAAIHQYTVGTTSLLNVANAQLTTLNLEKQLINLNNKKAQAITTLAKSTGGPNFL